ncbi:hypothetical protein Bca4012_011521 [Brassica carinata]
MDMYIFCCMVKQSNEQTAHLFLKVVLLTDPWNPKLWCAVFFVSLPSSVTAMMESRFRFCNRNHGVVYAFTLISSDGHYEIFNYVVQSVKSGINRVVSRF